MLKKFTGMLVVPLMAFSFAACSKKPAPAPPQAPVVVDSAPVQPPPAAVPAPPADTFEGEWKGDSGPDLPLSFSVEKNQVTSLNASYSGKNGTCNYNGGIGSDGPVPINNKTFTSRGKNTMHGETEFTATGTFTSPTEASGTLVWKGKSELCGDFNLEYKWTAKKAPAEAMD